MKTGERSETAPASAPDAGGACSHGSSASVPGSAGGPLRACMSSSAGDVLKSGSPAGPDLARTVLWRTPQSCSGIASETCARANQRLARPGVGCRLGESGVVVRCSVLLLNESSSK